MVVATWSFLPLFIVSIGGNTLDVGLVMGSIGITSLGSLPILAPLIDRYGRRKFIVGGIVVMGLSNGCFLLFGEYSLLMIVVRLFQGLAFAACFNGCSTAVIDLIPENKRAQGIGLFGVSGSLAVAAGPFLGEQILLTWGFPAYFVLLMAYGVVGCLMAIMVKESGHKSPRSKMKGFFPTAFHGGYLSIMTLAAVCGSAFAAMNTFFPLHARNLGLQAGAFFVCYGCSLIFVRVILGRLADTISREKLVLACLVGFGAMLYFTSNVSTILQTLFLGALFGIVQGLSYPAMMAGMVDRSNDSNRAVVVALFTGSFGVGINVSVFAWGFIANLYGLSFMFLAGGIAILVGSLVYGAAVLQKNRLATRAQIINGQAARSNPR